MNIDESMKPADVMIAYGKMLLTFFILLKKLGNIDSESETAKSAADIYKVSSSIGGMFLSETYT
eukprot:jgi/Antlo1/941/2457